MNKYIEKLKTIKEKQDGFSLIELVVAVGILAILSVVGVVAYSKITENARKAAVEAAAADVYTGATAYDSNGNDYKQAAKEWMDSSNGSITVEATKNGDKICVKATMEKHGIIAYKGAGCASEGVVEPGNGGSNSEAPNVDHAKIEAVFERSDLDGEVVEISLYGDLTKIDTIKKKMNSGDIVEFYDIVGEWGPEYMRYVIEIVSDAGTQTYAIWGSDFYDTDLNGITQWTYDDGIIVLGDNNMEGANPAPAPIEEEYTLDIEIEVYAPEYAGEYVGFSQLGTNIFRDSKGETNGVFLDSEGRGVVKATLYSDNLPMEENYPINITFTVETDRMERIGSREFETTVGELTKTGDRSYEVRYTLN